MLLKQQKNLDYRQMDNAVLNFLRIFSHKKVSSAFIAYNLNLSVKQVNSSINRLNNRGVRIRKLQLDAEIQTDRRKSS